MSQPYSSFDLFSQALYDERSTSIPIFLELYEKLLTAQGDENCILHANRLKQCREERTNRGYLSELRRNFNNLYSLIDKEYPNLKFIIEGRIKSIVNVDKKIVKNINEHKSLDLLRDTIAFRIILFGTDSSTLLTNLCYNVMNSIIKYNNINYTLCESNVPTASTVPTIDPAETQGIIIPRKSLINRKYAYGVKDFILFPKDNNYQSLHATFRRPKGGECFEVQVRTFDMHVLAENGSASHSNYKKKKYNSTTIYDTIDREKIHIPGYKVCEDGQIFDFIGLEQSLQILKRQKTY